MLINYKFIGILCLCMLNSCAYFKEKISTKEKEENIQAETALEQQLSSSAQSIERSLNILAMHQEGNHAPILNTAPLITPEGGMGVTADIDWVGPIEPLLTKLANITHYQVKTLGKKPTIPIIVSINQQHSIVADILKNASLQAGKRAEIVVFPANRIIELRYATS